MIILFYASIVAWILATIVISLMIVLFATRTLGRKKIAVSRQILTLSDKKLWICALLTVVLMGRFVFVYLSVFKNNPVAAFNAAMIKQYFVAFLLSLVWPPQIPMLLGSAVVLVLDRSRERASGNAAGLVRYDRRVFIGIGLAFLLLVTASFLLLHLNLLHALLFFSLILFGKYIACLVVVLSIHEQKRTQENT